ncbi:AsmA family protein [Alcaligenaceae bacterium]|nr:AsmA family protein [Alcaligenaceae bacterium]
MKVWLKRVLFSLVVVVIVALVGIAIFLLTFDPNAYKSKLEEVVFDRYQRTLSIKGEIELSLFPRIGLSVENVSLSNRNSSDTFASVDSARFAVAIWPLMFNRLVIDHVAVTGFKAWVTRDQHGQFNFRDLIERRSAGLEVLAPPLAAVSLPNLKPVSSAQAQPVPQDTDALSEPGKTGSDDGAELQIDIAGLDLKNGEIHLYDNITGSSARVVKLDVNTGRMTVNQAFDVALKGKLMGDFPVADANIDAQAIVKFNPDEQMYSAQRLNLTVAGMLGPLQARAVSLRGNLAYSAYSEMVSASGLELIVQGDVGGDTPIEGLDIGLTVPQLKMDRSQAQLKVEKLAYRARGKLPDKPFDIAFDAPSLAISPDAAQGEPISGTIKFGEGNDVLAVALGMKGIGGNASKLTFEQLTIDAGLKENARLVQVNMTSPAVWDVFEEKGGLSAMKGDIRIEDAALPGGSFQFPFIGSLQADLVQDQLVSEINAVLSGSRLDFRVNATQLKDPKVKFTLAADRLDFNTLFPPPAPPAAAPPAAKDFQEKPPAPAPKETAPPAAPDKAAQTVNLSFLQSADVHGELAIGELKVQDLEAKKFAANVLAADGKLTISGIKADLYEGQLAGTLTADAQNAFTGDLALNNVSLAPFLQAAARERRLEGRGSINLKLASQGNTVPALEAGLTGTVQGKIRDGAIRGIDVAQTLREVNAVVRNMFSGQLPDLVTRFDMDRRTPFSALDVDMAFDHGQGTVKKLNLVAPVLRVTQGTPASVDLVNDQLDVMLNIKVAGDRAARDNAGLAELRNVTVPVRVSGPFDHLGYQVQWKEVGSKAVKEAVQGGLLDLLSSQIGKPPAELAPAPGQQPPKKPVDPVKSIGEALKGLLGQ